MTFLKRKKNVSQYVIIVLCWLVYVIAYFGRYSYNANITLFIDDYGVTKAQAGLVTTMFFFAYGIGQIVNGIMSKRYNKKWLFPIVLALSSVINLAVFFKIPFSVIKYLWLLNGFVQSCLWSGIISVISRTVDDKHMNTAMVFLGTTTCVGTIATYVSSSVFAYFNNYRLMFLFAAVVMTLLGLIWFLIYSPDLEINENNQKSETEKHDKTVRGGFLGLMIMLGAFAIIHNIIKDGLTVWMPDILKERYMLGDSFSILLTVVLPILGVFGAFISIRAVNRLNNFITVVSLFFSIGVISIGAVVLFPQLNVTLAVIFFGIMECMMHGINNISTSVAPLKLHKNIDSGKAAGILNGCCYTGSTISSYGLGKLADLYGWQVVLNTLLVLCVAAVAMGTVYNMLAGKSRNLIYKK